jgi:hypothetical protein
MVTLAVPIFIFIEKVIALSAIIGLFYYACKIKEKRINDLWDEIINYTVLNKEKGLMNNNYLNERILSPKIRLQNIIEYCNLHINANNKNTEIIDRLNNYRKRAYYFIRYWSI